MDIIKKINAAKTIWQVLPNFSADDLERAIVVSADSYYNTGISLISDKQYDILVERLKQLDPKSAILQKTGVPVKGKKVKLPVWMGSMDKIKAEEKLVDKWKKSYKGPYVASDKLDGISCLLTVVNEEINLFTRGDGSYGQQISHLADLINMPISKLLLSTSKQSKIYIRGELIMAKSKFEKYSKIMSNARNMVAGIVNSKKESVNEKHAHDVDFIAYELIEPNGKPSKQMDLLEKLGMNIVYYDIYKTIDLVILDGILQKRKKKSIYEIDGIIVTDDSSHPKIMSGNPPYSFAYKGLTETANTKVISVEWRPSKDGILVPRIHFEKVRLSQADLEYTTGFNAKYIHDNKIGPGAVITVIRSGDVIPYIMDVVKPAQKPSFPDNFDYNWDDNHVNIILKHASSNEDVVIRRLTKFLRNIGVDNMSEGIVTRLVKAGYDSIPKIVSLTVDDFLKLDGFKDTLANKLYNNIKTSLNNLDILTLMVASNIFGRGFGERKIKKILDNYPTIADNYSKKTHNSWKNNILSLEGFDEITTTNFLNALPEFQEFYKNISKIIHVKPYTKKIKKKGIFQGQVVVFTGFRNDSWKKFIEEEGGRVGSSVSSNTTLLLYNDGEEDSSKYKHAKELEIKTMPKSEFSKKFNI
ncbi:MAG: NAD-dependent DNA ligase [Satyrvirus sp.]|uniref:DNA ligase (NAD(+)) n=1 Tax=Satyrvirus sp. TaxID=2487771 RepID=A0A3G5AFM4_9VIRU|nr:MAG: NAD-dependent DNA ligase [Satyrvirus sp.]